MRHGHNCKYHQSDPKQSRNHQQQSSQQIDQHRIATSITDIFAALLAHRFHKAESLDSTPFSLVPSFLRVYQ